MNIIRNITSAEESAEQRHFLEFSRGSVELILIYEAAVQMWKMNVTYTRSGDTTAQRPIYGVKLANVTTHFKHRNWPFDFSVVDTSGNGVDPFRADDFSTGRSELYFVTPAEMIDIRGVDVQ